MLKHVTSWQYVPVSAIILFEESSSAHFKVKILGGAE